MPCLLPFQRTRPRALPVPPRVPGMGDHDAEHFRDSYRDAVAYLDAVRHDDGHGMAAVRHNTPCGDCFVESLGQIGARLGDRPAAQRAADDALAALARERDEE
jgi:hypothetical protein